MTILCTLWELYFPRWLLQGTVPRIQYPILDHTQNGYPITSHEISLNFDELQWHLKEP